MHGQRDLLDWQDESKKEGIERESPPKESKHWREKMLGMVVSGEEGTMG
jgi:hypothetical protein